MACSKLVRALTQFFTEAKKLVSKLIEDIFKEKDRYSPIPSISRLSSNRTAVSQS